MEPHGLKSVVPVWILLRQRAFAFGFAGSSADSRPRTSSDIRRSKFFFAFLHGLKTRGLLRRRMKTIVVSGEKSGVGKTYIAEKLLNCLQGWSALKVTVTKEGSCPHEKDCGICAGIQEPFDIIKDPDIINQTGKDTSRLKAAGAKEVIWLKAKPEGLKEGLDKALAEFSECGGVIIEGTSVLKFLNPDLNIHLYEKGKVSLC